MYFNLTNYGFLVVPLLGYGSYSRILNPLDDPERLHSLCSNTLVRSAYVLRITMPIELCITYPEMLVFAHTRLAIVSRPFDAVLRTNLYRFFIRCTSSSNFFIRSLQMSEAFCKSSFFLNYSTLFYVGDQIQ